MLTLEYASTRKKNEIRTLHCTTDCGKAFQPLRVIGLAKVETGREKKGTNNINIYIFDIL